MKHSLILFLYCFSFCLANAQTGVIDASRVELKSPDKNITLHFYQKQITDGTRMMFYDVTYKDKPVISESQFDIQLDNHLSEQAMAIPVDLHKDWCENLKMTGIDTSSSNIRWTPVCGEQKEIQDHFKAAAIHFVKDNNAIYKMDVELRVYNEGVAIRYFFPENERGTYCHVMHENTTFSLPAGTKAWVSNWAQGPYQLLPLNNWQQEAERPLTLELSNGLYACVTEAAMTDYARTKFKLSNKPNTIVTSMYTPADLITQLIVLYKPYFGMINLRLSWRAGDTVV